jgi:transposase
MPRAKQEPMPHAPQVPQERKGRRAQRPYPAEYRAQMVELVRSGRSPESLEKEFGVTAPTIRSWVRQADRDSGVRADGLTTDERAELAALRRETRRLREERDILKKFAAWSAQEMNSTPTKRSGS